MGTKRIHSVKVPRLYKEAAKAVKQVKETGQSPKNIVFKINHPNKKAIYALVTNTIKKYDQIDLLFERAKILEKEKPLDPWLARILVVELLWGKKVLIGECKPVKTILSYQQILNAQISDPSIAAEHESKNEAIKPRYARVNTLRTTTDEVKEKFRGEGWTFVQYANKNDYKGFLNKISLLKSDEFMADLHIGDLLVFPPKTEFYNHPAYKEGLIILEDKASCFPVEFLNPSPNSTVLDMCAAPGIKTTHIAALLKNQGVVYAVDRDKERLKSLQQLVEQVGATCVKPIHSDVLKLTGDDCPDVEYILVDPSCTGSGITDRVEFKSDNSKSAELRVKKLAGLQAKMLKHAFFKFPNAKRVVYSTCSVHPEENEEVVRDALNCCTTFKLVSVEKLLNAKWHNFGFAKYKNVGKFCFRSDSEHDLTNGFFVAVFEKVKDEDVSGNMNKKENEEMTTNILTNTLKKGNQKKKPKSKVENICTKPTQNAKDCSNNQNKKNNKTKQKNEMSKNNSADGGLKQEDSTEVINELNNGSGSKKMKNKRNLNNESILNKNTEANLQANGESRGRKKKKLNEKQKKIF